MAFVKVARRRLLAAGWSKAGTAGSHIKFIKRSAAGVRTAIVPKHHEIALGTLRSILRQAGNGLEEFDRL